MIVEKVDKGTEYSNGWKFYVVRNGDQIVGMLSAYEAGEPQWLVDAGYGASSRFVGVASSKDAALAKLLKELGKDAAEHQRMRRLRAER